MKTYKAWERLFSMGNFDHKRNKAAILGSPLLKTLFFMTSFAPRRRTADVPKGEAGLAEWTSKIKALQAQVDADEEAEQKRLEQEIAASRLARLRRSQGIASGSRIANLGGFDVIAWLCSS
jgi:hypothetical protein